MTERSAPALMRHFTTLAWSFSAASIIAVIPNYRDGRKIDTIISYQLGLVWTGTIKSYLPHSWHWCLRLSWQGDSQRHNAPSRLPREAQCCRSINMRHTIQVWHLAQHDNSDSRRRQNDGRKEDSVAVPSLMSPCFESRYRIRRPKSASLFPCFRILHWIWNCSPKWL